MPFSNPVPRSFNTHAINRYAPNASGIYGISNGSEWILIEETEDIQRALLCHLGETNSPLQRRMPTGFVFDLCNGLEPRVERQGQLVSEYRPTCNRPWKRNNRGTTGSGGRSYGAGG